MELTKQGTKTRKETMSALIQNLHVALEEATPEWTWSFVYTSEPRRRRIRLIGRNRQNPSQFKIIVLPETLIQETPAENIARSMARLLPVLPTSAHNGEDYAATGEGDKTAFARAETNAPIQTQDPYKLLQKNYRQALEDLQTNAATACPFTEESWSAVVGRNINRLMSSLTTKTSA